MHSKFLMECCPLQYSGTDIQDLRHCRYLNKTDTEGKIKTRNVSTKEGLESDTTISSLVTDEDVFDIIVYIYLLTDFR